MTCTQCGTQNPDQGTFCIGCGTALQQQAPQAAPFPQYAAPAAAPVDDEAKDAQDNKVMGILAYLGFLVLVPIFAAKESKFAKFHANQGLLVCLLYVAYGIVYGILNAIFAAIFLYNSFGLYSLLTTVLGLGFLVVTILEILGIVNAVKGEKKELPVIGKFKILK